MLAPELLNILACPLCHGELLLSDRLDGLVCPACKLKFSIRDGIPVLLQDQAEKTE